jgi:hypothetical protein
MSTAEFCPVTAQHQNFIPIILQYNSKEMGKRHPIVFFVVLVFIISISFALAETKPYDVIESTNAIDEGNHDLEISLFEETLPCTNSRYRAWYGCS